MVCHPAGQIKRYEGQVAWDDDHPSINDDHFGIDLIGPGAKNIRNGVQVHGNLRKGAY